MFIDCCLVFLSLLQVGDSVQHRYSAALDCLLCDDQYKVRKLNYVVFVSCDSVWPLPRGICHKVHLSHLTQQTPPEGVQISKITVCKMECVV